MNKLAKIFGITVLAVCLMTGCSEKTAKDEAAPEVKENVQKESPVKVVEEEPKKEVNAHKIGDTVDAEGIKVTTIGIEPFTGETKQFHPIYQDHAVKIGVIIENTTDRKVNVSLYEFKMYDVEGNELRPAMPADEKNIKKELAVGEKVEGAIYYDVPAQEGFWKLRYTAFSTGGYATWKVPAK